jgi:hypothetical protein
MRAKSIVLSRPSSRKSQDLALSAAHEAGACARPRSDPQLRESCRNPATCPRCRGAWHVTISTIAAGLRRCLRGSREHADAGGSSLVGERGDALRAPPTALRSSATRGKRCAFRGSRRSPPVLTRRPCAPRRAAASSQARCLATAFERGAPIGCDRSPSSLDHDQEQSDPLAVRAPRSSAVCSAARPAGAC